MNLLYHCEGELPTLLTSPLTGGCPHIRTYEGTYEGKYPHSLFNKGVRTENEAHVGHIMKETNDKIVVFGHGNDRFDIPKSEIIAVGMNVIVRKNFPELFVYKATADIMTQKHFDID